MSDNFKSREHLNLSAASDLGHSSHPIFPETPEDSDLEDDAPQGSASSSKREPLIFPTMSLSSGSRNMSGALYVFSRSKKQFQVKWCVLGEGKLSWYNEDTSLAIPKESFLLTNIFSITKKSELQHGPQSQDLFCFDLAVLNMKGKFAVYNIGVLSSHDRETWLEKISQSLSKSLSTFSMSQASRLGWAYVKLGKIKDTQS